MSKCPKCGTDCDPTHRFCPGCATALAKPGEEGGGQTVRDSIIRGQMQNTSVPINITVPPQGEPGTNGPATISVQELVFCGVCGKRLPLPEWRCPKCGEFVCEVHYIGEKRMCETCTGEEEDALAAQRAQHEAELSEAANTLDAERKNRLALEARLGELERELAKERAERDEVSRRLSAAEAAERERREAEEQPQREATARRARYSLIDSHLGNNGPRYEPQMTPSKLGWESGAQAYPSKFVVNPTDGAEMVWMPAGEFRMGSTTSDLETLWKENGWTRGRPSNEHPHDVGVSEGFWLYKHQVTNEQYGEFLSAMGHEPHPWWSRCKEYTDTPASLVTWDDASAYSLWVAGRLPTEAEWEWSARGPSARLFPWGDEWDRQRCCCAEYWAKKPLGDYASWERWYKGIGAKENDKTAWTVKAAVSNTYLQPVGRFASGASWCGALDMAGNVNEWCSDWYDAGYYQLSPSQDPLGPSSGAGRVVRGGGWHTNAFGCRSAMRGRLKPFERGVDLGFRPVVAPLT